MGTLDIHSQARRVLLTWVFYYDELPSQLVLPEASGEKISLTNLQDLKPSLSKVAATAFLVKLKNQLLPTPKPSQIIVLPDKTCLIILTYPVEGNGPLEVRAPILRLLPPNYLINVRFMTPDGKVGSTLIDRNSPPLMAMVKGQGTASPESPAPETGNPFRTAFTMELGTAWVHTNWILLGILLIVSNPIRRAAILLLAVIGFRILLVYLVLAHALSFPWQTPAFLLCLPMIVIAALATRPGQNRLLLTAAALGSSLLYTAYDLQFLPTGESSLPSLIGYQSGFLAGFLLALAIILGIGLELKKSIQFQGQWWRAKICWAAAAISLWISIYGLVVK